MFQQESRIKAMEMNLEKMKKEKEAAESSKKYGEERFFKFKTSANKDIKDAKKTVKQKEQAVSKLKSDLKKTETLVA
mgnify:CR=1 FL=1